MSFSRSSASFVTRRAELSDLASVLILVSSMHGQTHSGVPSNTEREVFEHILADPNRFLLVAAVGHTVVGTADMLAMPNLSRSAQPWAVVSNVSVAPEFRRKGIASVLLKELIQFARDAGCYKIELTSNATRVGAHGLYESLGFDAAVNGFRQYLVPVSFM